MESIVLVFAFASGLAIRQFGYPPLLGYLIAGFIGHAFGIGSSASLAPIADAGIVLLLFTIGLKLKLSSITPRYVWGTALLHMAIAVPLTTVVIVLVGTFYTPLSFEQPTAAWSLAIALSFSSTVFAVKMFDERGETASFYASIAVGILVIQDVIAVIYLVVASGLYPSPWAVLLLLLPLLRRPLRVILQRVGHGELLLLCGVTMAFAAAELFDVMHLKAGLGALVAGMLIATTQPDKSKELFNRLSGLKDLLLVGFILQIGYYGFPSLPMLMVALALTILILLRPLIYFTILICFGLRARTSALVGVSLFNYSEFGLIVAAYAVQDGILSSDWVTTLALAMALSFILATPVNNHAHRLYRHFRAKLVPLEKSSMLTVESIGSLGDADTVVLGMGRVGRGAYAALQEAGYSHLVGIDENYAVTRSLQEQGFNCVHGDASDRDFWERTNLVSRKLLLLGLSNHRENLAVVNLARELGYANTLAVATRFPDEKKELEALGCVPFYLYSDVGRDFAVHTLEALKK